MQSFRQVDTLEFDKILERRLNLIRLVHFWFEDLPNRQIRVDFGTNLSILQNFEPKMYQVGHFDSPLYYFEKFRLRMYFIKIVHFAFKVITGSFLFQPLSRKSNE